MKLAWVLLLASLGLLVAAVVGVNALWTGTLGSIGLLAAATVAAVAHDAHDFDDQRRYDQIIDVPGEPHRLA